MSKTTQNPQIEPAEKEFEEKMIQVSRVSKKTKGGNKMGFSVLMVVGDKKGRVGVGLGKAGDVSSAMKKGVKKAKKKLITVPTRGTTIPFSISIKHGAARIMLKPAPKGSGVIAGGPVRAVVDAAGIRDISSKILGTGNQASNVYATFAALQEIERLVKSHSINTEEKSQVHQPELLSRATLAEKKDLSAVPKKAPKGGQVSAKKPARASTSKSKASVTTKSKQKTN